MMTTEQLIEKAIHYGLVSSREDLPFTDHEGSPTNDQLLRQWIYAAVRNEVIYVS